MSTVTLDTIDRSILAELVQDGRISWRELGERVGLSAPAVAERVRAMEASGVITGYHARVDPAKVGLVIEGIIRLSSRDERVDEVAKGAPEVVEMKRVTGTDSAVMRVFVTSTGHLEELLTPFWETNTQTISNIVTSTVIPARPVDLRFMPLSDR